MSCQCCQAVRRETRHTSLQNVGLSEHQWRVGNNGDMKLAKIKEHFLHETKALHPQKILARTFKQSLKEGGKLKQL